jgi:allantoinase
LELKRAEAEAEVRSDVAFWGGLVPGNLGQLEPMARAGVCGFKAFMVDSGVAEFPPVGLEQIRDALQVLARLGLPLLVHAEDPAHIRPAPDGTHYVDYLGSRAPEAEEEAVAGLIEAAADTGGHVHVLHLATAGALPAMAMAKERGVRITAETCPHYLFFSSEDIPDGATEFKCAPPIRERSHQDGLWAGLADGTIDMVVSDHSPAPPELKAVESGDFGAAWGGISSVQLRLAVTWTAARSRGWSLDELVPKLAAAPAALAGLADRKGEIAPGLDADLVVFDPEAEIVVDPQALEHRHPLTPYAGRALSGQVRMVTLRGMAAGPLTEGLLLDGPRARRASP